jgi:LuxR family maltose regulon positive regulatory protein
MEYTDPLIQTKLNRPRIIADLVDRPRLTAQLDQSRGKALILVSASAGYGKSILLSSWLKGLDHPSAWLSLDEDDDDLDVFLRYFLAAIDSIYPGAVKETQALLSLTDLPPIRELANSLTNEIERVAGDFIFVIDDYHYINHVPIHDLLNELLLHPPRGMQLVLATRSDPPLSLVRLRAKGLATEIRTHEIRFTPEETGVLLHKLIGETIADSEIQVIDQQFKGWVTGLRLAVLKMRDPSKIPHILERMRGDSQFVREYLIEEVVSQIPQPIQEFLLKTSILDRLSGSTCDAIFGWNGPEFDG